MSLIFLHSCQDEEVFQEEIISIKPIEFVKVEEGRLHFSNKDFLNRKVDEFKEKVNRVAKIERVEKKLKIINFEKSKKMTFL